MNKILIPTVGPESWRQFLADPEKQWKRGYSAMATALSWEAAQGVPAEIERLLGGEVELLLAIPEHKVPLPGGKRDSQCDVFCLLRQRDQTIAAAVEAKVREPFGPTVEEWLNNASAGKRERLQFIQDLLGLDGVVIPQLRYQLLHRTAAAVIEGRRFGTTKAAMIVQSFSQEHAWFDDFSAFVVAMGGSAVRGDAVELELPSGSKLVLGWATGSQDFL